MAGDDADFHITPEGIQLVASHLQAPLPNTPDERLRLLLRADWRLLASKLNSTHFATSPLARAILEQRSRESCAALTPQLPMASPAGRWWFQVLSISNAGLSYAEKMRWAPGAFPARPVQAAAGRQWSNIAELIDEGFEEQSHEEPADGDEAVSRCTRGPIAMRLLLLPTKSDQQVELAAYEHSPISALEELVIAFRGMSKEDHAVASGDYAKILLEGPLRIFFTATTLLHPDNVRAVAVTCKRRKKEEPCGADLLDVPALSTAGSDWDDVLPATTATTGPAGGGEEEVLEELVAEEGESSDADSPTTRSPFFAAMKKLWGK